MVVAMRACRESCHPAVSWDRVESKMGLFDRKPNLDTPAGAVAHFLKHDSDPSVVAMRAHREYFSLATEGSWTGQTETARLEGLREDYRLYLAFHVPGAPPTSELSANVQFTVAFAGARSRVLGFLWERTYGESMQHLSASWTPMSSEELRQIFEPNTSAEEAFEQAARRALTVIQATPDEVIQAVDKIVLSAAVRAGARVVEGLRAWPATDAEGDDGSALGLIARIRAVAEMGDGEAVRQKALSALSFHFVLTFGGIVLDALDDDGPRWAAFMGRSLSPTEDTELDPAWFVEQFELYAISHGGGDSTRYNLQRAHGIISALGVPPDHVYSEALYAAMLLPVAYRDEVPTFSTELRGAGVME